MKLNKQPVVEYLHKGDSVKILPESFEQKDSPAINRTRVIHLVYKSEGKGQAARTTCGIHVWTKESHNDTRVMDVHVSETPTCLYCHAGRPWLT